jgi:hypothetical protein
MRRPGHLASIGATRPSSSDRPRRAARRLFGPLNWRSEASSRLDCASSSSLRDGKSDKGRSDQAGRRRPLSCDAPFALHLLHPRIHQNRPGW